MRNTLFRNKYRIPSTRLPGWDYSLGVYAVTICTHERICWFGEINEGKMVLSDLGDIVAEEWLEAVHRRPYVKPDAWIVMPNHFHGILHLDRPQSPGRSRPLGEVIGHFKGACSSRIWEAGKSEFDWQPRFFDQIVRDEETLFKLRRYIIENPLYWERDKNHPKARRPR